MISFDEWSKVSLKIGLIKKVEEIEGKDRLYTLLVDIGGDERTVVAGLKEFYSVDDLENKKAVFVSNLEPVKLAGIESQAMILAVKNIEGKYKVIFADDSVEEGTKVE